MTTRLRLFLTIVILAAAVFYLTFNLYADHSGWFDKLDGGETAKGFAQ